MLLKASYGQRMLTEGYHGWSFPKLQIKDFKLENQIFGHQMLPKGQQVLLAQKAKQKERQNDDLCSLRTKIELFAHACAA